MTQLEISEWKKTVPAREGEILFLSHNPVRSTMNDRDASSFFHGITYPKCIVFPTPKKSEEVLTQLQGTIVSLDDTTINVKFFDDLVVLFPRELFNNLDEDILLSMTIDYQIVKRGDGSRYQRFSVCKIENISEEAKKLLRFWDSLE